MLEVRGFGSSIGHDGTFSLSHTCILLLWNTRPEISFTAIQIPQKTATLVMAGISVLVLFYLLSNIFWWTLFSSGFICGAHSLFRDASMHKDMDDAVMTMEGDFHIGEDATFLNA